MSDSRGRGVTALRGIAVLLLLSFIAAAIGRERVFTFIGRGLVCEDGPRRRNAVLIDNFDYQYGLFRLGAELERDGLATRVIVPITSPNGQDATAVATEVAAVFSRRAGLKHWDIVTAEQREPISLTTAVQVRNHLIKERIPAVTLVSPWFRSRRSDLIYRTVLKGSGISVQCMPVYGDSTPQNWTHSWHGVQEVVEQFGKLQYYRFWVLPTAD